MSKKYDNIVYIGRFQPFHNGHKAVVDYARTLADRVVILVGSTNISRSVRNPFTARERGDMIAKCFNFVGRADKIIIRGIQDDLYNNNVWLSSVQKATADLEGKTAIIGHKRDHTSFYLDMFPQWDFVEVEEFHGVNATAIRRDWYSEHDGWLDKVPQPIQRYMHDFKATKVFEQLKREWKFIKEYKQKWETAPYPPTFVTADAVFVHSGHILLVERKAEPGKGLYALPGGFVGQHETIEDACIRELKEETRLKLPEKVIKGSQKGFKVFDHPDRSLRGRTITNAFYYVIETGELPKVKGADDAEKAMWVPLGELDPLNTQMFEDHQFIIKYFIGN